jgi:membrane associated rhomboid family serine protease
MNHYNEYRPGPFGYLPVVTKNIIIINVILFVFKWLLEKRGINLDDYLGLHDHLSKNFRPHQFITYIFMHSTDSIYHILFNMFGVYIFGQALEQVWGPKRYLIFYLLTGLGAALVQYLIMHLKVMDFINNMNALSEMPGVSVAEKAYIIEKKDEYINSQGVIGASGSLFGLLGGFGMLFPNRYLYLYFFFPIKAKWFVVMYGGLELFTGIRNDPMDNVAHFAHLGGLAVGLVIVYIWRKRGREFY